MRKWLNVYFGFSRREFNGLIGLIILIWIVILFPYAYAFVVGEEPVTEADRQAVMQLALAEKERLKKIRGYKEHYGEETVDTDRQGELFIFDPNTIDRGTWEQFGLSERQAGAIIRYREKGGRFRKKEDLQKMYTISTEVYHRIAPFIRIGKVDEPGRDFEQKQVGKSGRLHMPPVLIEVNGADTTELDKIKGIGSTFAKRIVKYRERIGGFYKKEQLMEVFGLDSAKFIEIKDQVTIDVTKLRKIKINTAAVEDFKNHPYIRYKQANALVAYRKQHGNYSNIADLNKVAILNPETIDRLAAYLEF
uniref:ComEA family DNA-binding protein n=1 Tax=Pedobacter schmidteae TaxID=2201271 RepID=UPI000EB3892A|nr:helix-hairpin-helix domain-containing protein [Pedobacter schmidteae]